jgi:hypothetical protein
LKKYYPTKEVWRFFQKPKGLDLDKTLSEGTEGSPPFFAVLFYFWKYNWFKFQIFQKKGSHPKRAAYQLRTVATRAEGRPTALNHQ